MSTSARLGFDALNAALKAAGEETRLRVLALLAEAELTVSDLTDILRQSQPRISRHLKHLADAAVEAAIRSALAGKPFRSLLDLGTGTGRMLELFGHEIERGLGLDLSLDMLLLACLLY